MEATKIAKSSQEQAVASWINYLNQIRLDRLMEALRTEEDNLKKALSTVNETLKTISRDIVNNGNNENNEEVKEEKLLYKIDSLANIKCGEEKNSE